MSASFEKINYSLRPAKAIERKMLCEGFSRLYPFQRVSEYGYVGFGSIYFADFSLIHNLLGIQDMESIEGEAGSETRCLFNCPFNCIRLNFGMSSEALPARDWKKRLIIWLDDDKPLSLETPMLSDVSTVVAKASSGTMLVISVNAHPRAKPDRPEQEKFVETSGKPFDLDNYRLSCLEKDLEDRVPLGTKGEDLRGADFAKVVRQVLTNEIEAQLTARNSGLPPEEKLEFKQVFNFHYSDGARMLTIGGVLVQASDSTMFNACQFNELHFARFSEEVYTIKVPNLTSKEVKHLNAQLPADDLSKIERRGVPMKDVLNYSEVYRYFPAYHEILFT